MKNIFKGYYRPTKEEFDTLWDNAIFIFDTNVLLNLYRYQSSTRDSLFKVIEDLVNRVWIPYHVGLEFQRNRLKVIAAQHKRYSEVQNTVSRHVSNMKNDLNGLQLKKRHSHINPDKLIENIEKIESDFLLELKELEEKSISVNSDDEIRDRIDKLFNGKVGNPPSGQADLDNLFNEAKERYDKAIPPGFEDSEKDDKSPDEFTYAGITYKRKYGDIIIWKQIIGHAKKESLKDVIFITDDTKSDWWWKIDSNGEKTIGVRPELTDELSREAGVERFFVYKTDGFLRHANEKLNTEVTREAIEEVREVSVARRFGLRDHRQLAKTSERAVFKWLENKFPDLEENQGEFPDFIAHQDNIKYGFEVKLIRDPQTTIHRLRDIIFRAAFMLNMKEYYEFAFIFVVLDEAAISETMHLIKRRIPKIEGNIKVIVGKAEIDEGSNSVYEFIPYEEIHIRNCI